MPRWQDAVPEPYPPPEPGEKARMLGGPVDPPPPPPEPGKQQRSHPGDPSCEVCTASPRGYCDRHRDFHYAYDPVASLPGSRPAAGSREDQVRWSGDVRNPTVADEAELLRNRGRRL